MGRARRGPKRARPTTRKGPSKAAAPLPPPPSPPPQPSDLPPGWESAVSAAGKTYYFNRSTAETTWDKPAIKKKAALPPLPPPPASPPQHAVMGASASGSRYDPSFSDEQRLDRINNIRGQGRVFLISR